MKMTKRLLALTLAFLLAFGSVPTAAFADEGIPEPAPAAEPAPAPEPEPAPAPPPAPAPVEQPAAPAAPAEPAPAPVEQPAAPAEQPAETVEQPAETAPEAAPEDAAAPGGTEGPEIFEETAPEAAPEANENSDEYASAPEAPAAPETYTVTYILIRGDERRPEVTKDFTVGETLSAPEDLKAEVDALAADGYDVTWRFDSQDGAEFHLEDAVAVTEAKTVYIVAVAPVKQDAPAAEVTAIDTGLGFAPTAIVPADEIVVAIKVYNADGNVMSEQLVKAGDIIRDPGVPTADNMTFTGEWEATCNGSPAAVPEFGKEMTKAYLENFADEAVIEVNPVMQGYSFVRFLNEHDGVVYENGGKTGDPFAYDVTFEPVDPGKQVTGWQIEGQEGTLPLAGSVTLPATAGECLVLKPVLSQRFWITFETDGGSLVQPMSFVTGKPTEAPANPTKTGYRFVGWYQDGKEFRFGGTLTEDVKLTAKWEAYDNASYTVVIWTQKISDTTLINQRTGEMTNDHNRHSYDFLKSITVNNATVGSTIRENDLRQYLNGGNAVGLPTGIETTYCYFDHNKTVEADGSTVVNIYYDRQLLHYQFGSDHDHDKYGSVYGLYESTFAQNGFTWDGKYNWQVGKSPYTYLEGFSIASNTNFTRVDASGGHVYHYRQQLNGKYTTSAREDSIVTPNNDKGRHSFTLSNKFTGYTVDSYGESFSADGGSTKKTGDTAYYSSDDLHVYHKLKEYTLTYYAVNLVGAAEELRSTQVRYTDKLGNFPYSSAGAMGEPDRPDNIPSYYVFKGWFYDPTGQNAVDWARDSMPAHNVAVYAVWQGKDVTVSFDLKGGQGEKPVDQTVKAGSKATEPEGEFTKEGFEFAGWYTEDDRLFSFDSAIVADTALHAKWVSAADTVGVRYDAGEGTNAPTDDNAYTVGATAHARKGAAAPAGKTFTGWKLPNGDIVKPGESFELDGDYIRKVDGADVFTLTAVYADARDGVASLTYHANYPAGGDKTAVENDLSVNAKVPLKSYTDFGWAAPDGYDFMGWAKFEEATTFTTTIRVDAEGSNDVYAVWQPKAFEGTITYKTEDGTELRSSTPFAVTPDRTSHGSPWQWDVEEQIPLTLPDSEGSNYMLEAMPDNAKGSGWQKEGLTVAAVYTKDVIGPGGEPDNVPDKYQITVTYKVVNGTFADVSTEKTEVVTLRDGDEPSETGSADLTAPTGMLPSAGYKNEGSWDKTPGQVTSTDNGRIYTYTFEQEEYTVSYEWTNEPKLNENEEYAPGSEAPTLPEDGAYKVGDHYVIDEDYYEGFQVKVNDQYGNLLRTYTFSGWTPAEGGLMGAENVTVTGSWTVEEVEPETYQHDVTYSVTGDVPAGYNAPEKQTYTQGQTYTVEAVPNAADYTKDNYDGTETVYTFDGWSLEGEQTMGDADVTITGTWTAKIQPAKTPVPEPGPGGEYNDNDFHLSMESWTYDGNGREPDERHPRYEWGVTVWETPSYKYYDANGKYLSDTCPVDVGSYYVEATWPNRGILTGHEYETHTSDKVPFTISPAPLTVHTGSAEKFYDGDPLTEPSAWFDGLVARDRNRGASVEATGSQTEIGSSPNTYKLNWGDVKYSNYQLYESLGTLTVNERKEFTLSYKFTGEVPAGAEKDRPADKTIREGETWTAAVMPEDINDKYDVREDGNLIRDYTFEGWDPASGRVEGDVTVTGNWTVETHDESEYEVTIKYEATEGGTVDKGTETQVLKDGKVTAAAEAEAKAGYHFTGWTAEIDGVEFKSEEEGLNYTFDAKAKETYTFTANFEEDADVTIKYVATEGGTVSSASETLGPATGEAKGSRATAEAGYHFVNWTNEENEEVSTDASFVPGKVDGLNVAATYTAHFEKNTHKVTVKFQSDDETDLGQEDVVKSFKYKEEYNVNGEIPGAIEVDGVKYVKVETKGEPAGTMGDEDVEIIVTYSKDVNDDDRPDKDQELVVTVTGEKLEKTYDGTEYGIGYTVTVTVDGNPVEGVPEWVGLTVDEDVKSLSSVNVIDKDLGLVKDETVKMNPQSTFAATLNVEDGHLTINPAQLTITWTAEAEYTGSVQTFQFGTGNAVPAGLQGSDALESLTGTIGTEKSYKGAWSAFQAVVKNGEADVTSNYDITLNVDITITGQFEIEVKNFIYDGQDHKHVVVTDKKTGLAVSAGDLDIEYKGDTVNVGDITVTVTGKAGTVYADQTAQATYKITPRPLHLMSEDGSWPYDGNEHARRAGTVLGAADGENITADPLSFPTVRNVGDTKENKFQINWDNADPDNYEIAQEDYGTVTITPAALDETNTDVSTPADVVYDGAEHKWSPSVWATDGMGRHLVEGTDYDVTYSTGDFKNVGEITVTVTFKGNYSGTVTRTYKITPAKLTVTTGSASKVYDGEPLVSSESDVAGLVAGETATAVTNGTITEVGSVRNGYTMAWGEGVLSTNYEIEEEILGVLTVHPNSIDDTDPETVPDPVEPGGEPDPDPDPVYGGVKVSEPSNYVYDGEAHQWAPAVTDKNGDPLTEGKDYTVSYGTEDFTNVHGTITVTITGTGNYSGTVTRTYEITRRPVTLRSEDGSWPYDGQAHKQEVVKDVSSGDNTGLVANQNFQYSNFASITNVSENGKANTYDVADGTALKSNYNITKLEGKLNITSKSIEPTDPEDPDKNVRIDSPANEVYDGEAHQWTPTVTGANGALRSGPDYTVNYSTGDFINAGTITVTIEGQGNYSGTVTRTYQITPRDVTITANSAAKIYDGTALTSNGGTISGLVNNETATVTATGSRTDQGTSPNVPDVVWNGSAQSRNYTVTARNNGTLTINRRAVTLTSATASKPYDGTPLQATSVTANGFVAGQGATYYNFASQTNVGSNPNTFDYTLNAGTNADNYTITPVYGTLTVSSTSILGLTIGTPANSVYDGAAHQWAPNVTGANRTLVSGTDYTVTYDTTDFTDAGTIRVTITGIGNYSGSVTRTYRITPRPVTVAAFSAAKTYDGTALTAGGRITGLVAGETATVTTTGTRTDRGYGVNRANVVWNGSAKASNYTVTTTNGTLTVNPRVVTMTSASGTKTYDGQALRSGEVTATGFVAGQGATYNVTGAQTEVGSSDNIFTYTLNAGTNANNYTINLVYGTLTVEARNDLVNIEDNDTPLGNRPGGRNGRLYTLSTEINIEEGRTPLGSAPLEHDCCILHFVLMLGAMAVAMYYTHDQKKRQKKEFELRSELED